MTLDTQSVKETLVDCPRCHGSPAVICCALCCDARVVRIALARRYAQSDQSVDVTIALRDEDNLNLNAAALCERAALPLAPAYDALVAERDAAIARAEKAELTARNWQEAYDKMGDTAAHPLSVRLRRSIANEPGGRRRN